MMRCTEQHSSGSEAWPWRLMPGPQAASTAPCGRDWGPALHLSEPPFSSLRRQNLPRPSPMRAWEVWKEHPTAPGTRPVFCPYEHFHFCLLVVKMKALTTKL